VGHWGGVGLLQTRVHVRPPVALVPGQMSDMYGSGRRSRVGDCWWTPLLQAQLVQPIEVAECGECFAITSTIIAQTAARRISAAIHDTLRRCAGRDPICKMLYNVTLFAITTQRSNTWWVLSQ